MEGPRDLLVKKVQTLSDLELAVLVCLVAEQHCIVQTEGQVLHSIEEELKLIASNIFGLTWAVLECDEQTTLDDFGCGILVQDKDDDYFNIKSEASEVKFSSLSGSPKKHYPRISKAPSSLTQLDSGRIANMVIAKNLDRASTQVQVQALELIRGKRNFTRTAVHAAPRPFLFIALNELNTSRLTMHLNDQFFISHKHYFGDGLPNIEEQQEKERVHGDDQSTSSVIRTPSVVPKRTPQAALFSAEDLATFTAHMADVKMNTDVRAYLHNIAVFMRLHRAVAGGIFALATRHFNTLAYALAPLHGLNYISPSMVALAAWKIYPHRIVITAPENERSLQWGSSLDAVKAVLDGVTADDVVEEVLQSVEAPL